MSDEDDWEFAGPDDAKAVIRAAVGYLLRGATGGARGDIVQEIIAIVRQVARRVDGREYRSLNSHGDAHGFGFLEPCRGKATEVQTRAERRLGELLLEAESLGWIGRGRPKKSSEENVTTPVHFTKPASETGAALSRTGGLR